MKIKIELSRQGHFIVCILLLYFVFFGYIANVYEEFIGDNLLFLYQIFFSPRSFFSLIILITIVFYLVFKEQFFEYGIRNSIWLIPIIILMSWFWYWLTNGYTFEFLLWYFLRLETYITIITLLCVNLLTAIIAATAKEKYKQYKERITRLEMSNK